LDVSNERFGRERELTGKTKIVLVPFQMEVFGEALDFGVTDIATLWRWKLALQSCFSGSFSRTTVDRIFKNN
jgi:hypothetical protein